MLAGRKPKATALHVLEGTYNATKHSKRANELKAEGKPVSNVRMRKPVQRVWDRCIKSWHWLTEADSDKLVLYCFLQAEFEKNPAAFPCTKIRHLRSINSELGGDPVSRIRLGTPLDKKDDKKGKYFKD